MKTLVQIQTDVGKILDIHEFVTSIEWETTLFDQPGKLTLSIIESSSFFH
jgi:hypothetical protein